MSKYFFILLMSEVLYCIKIIIYRFLIYLTRAILALYWKKGKIVPPIRDPILLKSAKTLADDVRNEKLKSKDIVQAYINRIQEVEPYLNAVVEDRFEEALKEAAEVDKLIQSGIFSKQRLEESKPLLGVPVTVKVSLKVKGLRCTAGSKFFKDLVAEEDSPCVTLIKNAGGIVLATTNIPEFCLTFETNNVLHGRTCNPYDTSRTPGGSSGGEGALLGAGASVIGIGNDLAGSLRIPANFSGVYAHKATPDLVPSTGTFPVPPDDLKKNTSTGPNCRFVEDLVMMMKILTANNEKNVNFDTKVDFKKLKIFSWTSIRDPRVLPVDKEILGGINTAVSYFTSSYGATSQELKVQYIDKMNDIFTHLLQVEENYIDYFTIGKMKYMNTPLELCKLYSGKSNFSMGTIAQHNLLSLPFVSLRRNIPYYRELLKKLTEELDNLLDYNSVIICPTFPQTAPYHDEVNFVLNLGTCFVTLCNFTGMPGTAVPIGLSRNGMPLGLQIIGKINNDPLTIACAEELHKLFGGWTPPGEGLNKSKQI